MEQRQVPRSFLLPVPIHDGTKRETPPLPMLQAAAWAQNSLLSIGGKASYQPTLLLEQAIRLPRALRRAHHGPPPPASTSQQRTL